MEVRIPPLAFIQACVGPDVAQLGQLVDEGLALAKSMEDEQALDFFTNIKRKLGELLADYGAGT